MTTKVYSITFNGVLLVSVQTDGSEDEWDLQDKALEAFAALNPQSVVNNIQNVYDVEEIASENVEEFDQAES